MEWLLSFLGPAPHFDSGQSTSSPSVMALAVAESGGKGRQAEIESSQNQKVLDTPRTRDACRRLGLILEDLQFRSQDSFYIPGDLKEKQNMRFEHFDKRRKRNLELVLAERAKVIAQNAKKGEVPGVQSGQFLCMLESLFEKEAKRLESDLKGQLRQHTSLVKENEEQLDRERRLEQTLATQDARRLEVNRQLREKGEKVKEKEEKWATRNQELYGGIVKAQEEKQMNHSKVMVAEEERMQKFQTEKAALSSDKSAIFKAKCDAIKQKNAAAVVERREIGELKLGEIEGRLADVGARRDEELRRVEMRSEEQHLHLMDVRDAKNRMDRVDGYRRSELKEQISGNVERIETLLALKDQLLDQRRGRNLKAAATQGSKGLNLKRDCLPGPGQYEARASCMTEMPSVKMTTAVVPGMVDDAIKGTAKNPAPGTYDTNFMPNGDRVDQACSNGVKWGGPEKKSFLDDAIKAKEAIPAPGSYKTKNTLDHKGIKMKREKVTNDNLDKHDKKNYPVWARPAVETPGPAGYSTDDYTRKEVLRRAQRSLPNLTRDMLRPGQAKTQ